MRVYYNQVRRYVCTIIVPNQAIATYVTQWTYDSHNRLLEMIYPDKEKITYSYNLGGQLEKVHSYKSYGYDYVSKIGYDKFEQRTYLKYCNGVKTFYTYDPQCRTMARTTTTMSMARAFRWTLPAALGNLQTRLHSARLHGNSAAMTAA